MKRILVYFFAIAVMLFAGNAKAQKGHGHGAKTVHVRSYNKKNGTHVRSYNRSKPVRSYKTTKPVRSYKTTKPVRSYKTRQSHRKTTFIIRPKVYWRMIA